MVTQVQADSASGSANVTSSQAIPPRGARLPHTKVLHTEPTMVFNLEEGTCQAQKPVLALSNP